MGTRGSEKISLGEMSILMREEEGVFTQIPFQRSEKKWEWVLGKVAMVMGLFGKLRSGPTSKEDEAWCSEGPKGLMDTDTRQARGPRELVQVAGCRRSMQGKGLGWPLPRSGPKTLPLGTL